MGRFEKGILFFPTSARGVGPVAPSAPSILQGVCRLLESALYFGKTLNVGSPYLAATMQEQILRTAAHSSAVNFFSTRGVDHEFAARFDAIHFLYRDICVKDDGAELDITGHCEFESPEHIRFLSAFNYPSDLVSEKLNTADRAAESIVNARALAIKRTFMVAQNGVKIQDGAKLTGEPILDLSVRAVSHDDRSILFEIDHLQSFSGSEVEKRAINRKLGEYLIMSMTISLSQELGGEPVDVSESFSKHLLGLQENSLVAQIMDFQQVVLADQPSISDALFTGSMTVNEFYKLYERSERWREWTTQIADDTALISQYYNEIRRDRFLETLPARLVRFSFVAGCGFAAGEAFTDSFTSTGIALGLGLADAVIVDQCAFGWRPHHFIEKDLRRATQ